MLMRKRVARPRLLARAGFEEGVVARRVNGLDASIYDGLARG